MRNASIEATQYSSSESVESVSDPISDRFRFCLSADRRVRGVGLRMLDIGIVVSCSRIEGDSALAIASSRKVEMETDELGRG